MRFFRLCTLDFVRLRFSLRLRRRGRERFLSTDGFFNNFRSGQRTGQRGVAHG